MEDQKTQFDPTAENPITDTKGECPVEVIALDGMGLVIRSISSGREWGIAINGGSDGEIVEPTELEVTS